MDGASAFFKELPLHAGRTFQLAAACMILIRQPRPLSELGARKLPQWGLLLSDLQGAEGTMRNMRHKYEPLRSEFIHFFSFIIVIVNRCSGFGVADPFNLFLEGFF